MTLEHVVKVLASLALCGCVSTTMPLAQTIGPAPTLVGPKQTLIPNVNTAKATGWAAGASPVSAPGTRVGAFARGLDHPRWLYLLPNGDVLVAETNAPARPEDGKGLKGWVMGLVMKGSGAAVASANRITLLRDTDGDGVADLRSPYLETLNSPFGMALVGDALYVADSDAVLRFPYVAGEAHLSGSGTRVLELPAGPINHHWTKNLIASADGLKLYVTVGSNSNAAERGMDVEVDRASIWELDLASGAHRVFATGLRNPVGLAWEPHSSALWTVVNERDELGDDLVPDYMTSVRDGAFYGWPYSYYGAHLDARVKPQRPDLVAKAIAPDYALGAHTACLGLASSVGTTLPNAWAHGMFIGQHGSWNRSPRSGYKVVYVGFERGKPVGLPVDVLTGFLSDEGNASGRPVGVALDRTGALLVADDVGNTIWRVSASN
jgi:glucose/arabinose dehydrogenase